ncbi:MAG: tRNA pseudouridine(55) synthase TruB [Lachnospiraceae bacterium]|nr:tRNA pseudouridine(55) synthase TruB [Lachnospiraceae bacterium]
MFHGMMTIYKEAGYTSSDVVARLRGILHMKKIGHTGTLDPDAEGVLPVCLGNGTKLCDLIADRDKEYVAVMRLGVATDTQDMSGEVLAQISDEEVRRLVTPALVEETAAEFVGEISQVPPMYSAVKVNGKRLYEYARQGRTVERKARTITIHELEITKIDLPLVTMRVRCSKGTYIRTLCHDLGQKLGTGAAMEHLLRTRVGQFRLEKAIRLDEAESIMKSDDPGRIEDYILPVDSFFEEAPKARVRAEGMKYLRNGNAMKRSYTDLARETRAGDVRMYDEDGKFYALYRYDPARDELKNVKMFLS